MSKRSPAVAGSPAVVISAAHETVTRPISVANQARRRGRRPLRHALAWAFQLAVLAAYVTGVYLAVAVGLGAQTPGSDGWRSALRLGAVAVTAAGVAAGGRPRRG